MPLAAPLLPPLGTLNVCSPVGRHRNGVSFCRPCSAPDSAPLVLTSEALDVSALLSVLMMLFEARSIVQRIAWNTLSLWKLVPATKTCVPEASLTRRPYVETSPASGGTSVIAPALVRKKAQPYDRPLKCKP